MKSTFLKATTVLAFLFLGTSLSAQNGGNDNGLIGKARGAASDCVNNYTAQGYDIAANVETTGICFVSGSLHKVTLYAKFKCNSEICPQVMSALVAIVYFDCNNTVTSVECGTSAQ